MIILKNCTAIHFHPPLLKENIDIALEGGVIAETGNNLPAKFPSARILDMTGKCVSPGIVCAHNHFYSALARGVQARILPSQDFVGILENLWWRLDRALDEESLMYSGLVGALEAIKAGTTTVIDHNASPSYIRGSLTTLRKAFEQVGLRGILAYEITDRNGKEGMRQGVEESVDFFHSLQKSDKNEARLVETAIGAHAPFTLADDTLRLIAEAIAETKRGIHIHVAEDRYDASHSHQHYQKDLMERLEGAGVLNSRAILVHGVHLGDRDLDIINAADAFLIHNPRSNMNNSVGYMNALARVKNVGLGTDGIGSNMFEESKIGYFKNTDAGGTLSPGDILRYLQNGNELLGRYFESRFGRIEKGYAADLVVYDYAPPTPLNADNFAGHFIFGFSSRDVETVIVGGKIVYENRKFPFDVAGIYAGARRAAARLWKNMDALP